MKKSKSLLGAVWFFATITVVVTVAVLVYSYVSSHTSNNTLIAIIMLAVIVFLAALCTVIDAVRRKITVERPVRKILDATNRIAAGDFSVRLDIKHPYARYDEYDRIMDNFNKMAAELSKTAMINGDFVSNVSHEIKTPLAIIQNYASALKKDSLSEEDRKKYAAVLEDTSKRLTSLVVNILKLNKLENQEIMPEYTEVRLDDMLADVVLRFEDIIESKKLRLECDLQKVSVRSVKEYLDIVWNNLISNAVKFTESGGKIFVSLASQNGKAVVKIADTGCGIASETGAHIFEKFYQGDTSHAKEGNGLGLAMVKKVIDIIGGEIGVESRLGEGSVFTVVLDGVIK